MWVLRKTWYIVTFILTGILPLLLSATEALIRGVSDPHVGETFPLALVSGALGLVLACFILEASGEIELPTPIDQYPMLIRVWDEGLLLAGVLWFGIGCFLWGDLLKHSIDETYNLSVWPQWTFPLGGLDDAASCQAIVYYCVVLVLVSGKT